MVKDNADTNRLEVKFLGKSKNGQMNYAVYKNGIAIVYSQCNMECTEDEILNDWSQSF